MKYDGNVIEPRQFFGYLWTNRGEPIILHRGEESFRRKKLLSPPPRGVELPFLKAWRFPRCSPKILQSVVLATHRPCSFCSADYSAIKFRQRRGFSAAKYKHDAAPQRINISPERKSIFLLIRGATPYQYYKSIWCRAALWFESG